MTGSKPGEWWIFVPLIQLPARLNRRTKKLVKQSPWLTLNDRDSWHRRKRLTKYYRDLGAQATWIPSMTKAHVYAWLSYGNNRRLDPSNYTLTAKAVIDGFVDAGMLPDDNSKHLIGPDMRRDETLAVGLHMQIIRLE